MLVKRYNFVAYILVEIALDEIFRIFVINYDMRF